MGKSGDFTYASAAFEAAQEYNQDERTATERAADEAKRAPVTTSYQRWKSDPSGLDFPGVDTPTASPGVLPKDLKQSQDPDLSARARNEAPGQTLQTTTEELERQQLSQMDVSPGERRDSMVADGMGGVRYNSNVGGYVETDRADEEQKPPDIERGEDPFDMSTGGGALDSREGDPFDIADATRRDVLTDNEIDTLRDEFDSATESFDEIDRSDADAFLDEAAFRKASAPSLETGDTLAVNTTNTLLDAKRGEPR